MNIIPSRRSFLQSFGLGAAALALNSSVSGQDKIPGFEEAPVDPHQTIKWQPVSDRKVRVGIVGYGTCKFGAKFSFQDHPNVEVVAVSDLFPDRCAALAAECRCGIRPIQQPITSVSRTNLLLRFPVRVTMRDSNLTNPVPTITTTHFPMKLRYSRQPKAVPREC